MKKIRYPDRNDWEEILRRPALNPDLLEEQIAPVLKDVKQNGDEALKKYTKLFDQIELTRFLVDEEEFCDAENRISEDLKSAINLAKSNIEKFHANQIEVSKKIETAPGVSCWRKSVPISKIGFYIPGGTAPLFSTVLMLGIPAKIAGCKEIIMCTPPDKNGRIQPAVLYAARLFEIGKVFKIGGAQAIAAMAYGTESIPRVHKIFGPGNQYVTTAKQLVNKTGIAIDLPAGPTELAVIADESCHPGFVAADLLSQAEHGVDSQTLLISTGEETIDAIHTELKRQIVKLPRQAIAEESIENSKSILVNNKSEAIELTNEYAPEHLILAVNDAKELAEKVENAGSVFLGNYAPESAGDYASGTNHTLPTNGLAKAYSGVSVDSFVKKITFQHVTKEGINNIGGAIEKMAEAEGLFGHKEAVTLRLDNLNHV